MASLSIIQLPKPGDSVVGIQDLVIGWFPKSSLKPNEQTELINHGFHLDQIGGRSGYFTDASFGTIPYYRAQKLKENVLTQIRQNPTQRYVAVFSSNE